MSCNSGNPAPVHEAGCCDGNRGFMLVIVLFILLVLMIGPWC